MKLGLTTTKMAYRTDECDEDFEQDESVWDAIERMSELNDDDSVSVDT